ncbi:MAG TPA: response regulator [Opitutaceae bacterium]|nr:response regulator [Opitutaceae bacterium]
MDSNDPFPRTVLLVDHNPADLASLKRLLANAGIRLGIAVARSGEEAISFLRGTLAGGTKPRLMLIDVDVPGGGVEVVCWARSRAALRDMRIVGLTSDRNSILREQAHALQVDRVLRKMPTVAELTSLFPELPTKRDPTTSG